MGMDEDDYGRRRADDHAYAHFGNKPVPVAEAPLTGIAKILAEAGMKREDAQETGPAILKLMEKMGPEAPLLQQQRMVENFMTRETQKPEIVAAVTGAALGQMKWKPAEAKAGGPVMQAASPQPPKAKL